MVYLYPEGHLLCLSGLFGLTFLLPNIIIIIFILKVRLKRPSAITDDCDVNSKLILIMLMQAMVISGSLALVDRGVLKHDEAVIHYRYLTAPLPTLMLKQEKLANVVFVQKHLCKDLESLLTSVPCPGIVNDNYHGQISLNLAGVGGS